MSNHEHNLEYCLPAYNFAKKYGRWLVRCTDCRYESNLVSDYPPNKLKIRQDLADYLLNNRVDVSPEIANAINEYFWDF